MNIRNSSLPFDWLKTDPIKGLKYINENIENDFAYFLDNLEINERGFVVSNKYPYAEFMHEPNLKTKKSDRNKFDRRIKRLKGLLKKDLYFLYNVTSESLNSVKNVDEFYNSVLKFTSQLKKNQLLCI